MTLPDTDVMILIDHPYGSMAWVTLEEWKRHGPGPRPGLAPAEVKSRISGERLPMSVVPFRYRNGVLYRFLVTRGLMEPTWSAQYDPRPSAYWRTLLAQDTSLQARTVNESWDSYLRRVWQANYTRAKGTGDAELTLVAACGLLTYGRINMVAEILSAAGAKDFETYKRCICDLVPLPDALKEGLDPSAVTDWLRSNVALLRWDEHHGHFALGGQT